MRINRILICGLVLLINFISLQAQSDSISLKDAIQYALENKADAKKAKLQIKNGEYQITEAKAGALPSISLNGGLNYNPILQETALPGDLMGSPGTIILVPFGTKWNSNIGVNVTQNLFNQQVFVGLKAARSTQEFYQINADLTDEQVIERVATAYYQVFVQEEKLETIDSSYNSTLRVRDIIQSLFDNGLAKKIDLDRTNVTLTNISTTRHQLLSAVQMQKNALKFYMGKPIEEDIQLVKNEYDVEDILMEDKISMDNRREIQLLEKQKQLLGYQKKAIEAEYYPSLSLSANYTWQGFGDKFPIFTGQNQGTFWTDFSTIGLSLKVPIFNGLGIKARVNQAQIDILEIEEDIADAKLGLDLAYQDAKTQIENSLINIQNQTENVNLAQLVVDNTKSNYQYGLANLTELLDVENALVEAKVNLSNAILTFKLAEIQLIKAKGELKTLLD